MMGSVELGKITPVTDGVFFTQPDPLPRGKHKIARDVVEAAQRERIMIAATELLAAHGHRGTGAREVCVRAGLSLSAYYASFSGKEDAVFAAYDRFIQVLAQRLVAVDGEAEGRSWQEYVEAMMGAYLDTLASDLVVARAFQVELDGLGRPARERRRLALGGLTELLRVKHVERDPGAAQRVPAAAYVTGVYGVRQLASDALDTEEGPEATRKALEQARSEAVDWVTRLFGDSRDRQSGDR